MTLTEFMEIAALPPESGAIKPKLRPEIHAIRKAQTGLLIFYLAASGASLLPNIPYILCALFFVIFLYRVVKKDERVLLRGASASSAGYALFLQVLFWLVASAFGVFLLSVFVSWLGEGRLFWLWTEMLKRTPEHPAVLRTFSVGTALIVAVLVPICEELFFRGYLLQAYRRVGDGFAILASALLFAVGHMAFFNIIYAFFCGLFWAILTVRYNSVLPSILCHMINNFAVVFLMAPSESVPLTHQEAAGALAEIQPQAIFYVAAVLLGSFYLFCRICIRLSRQSEREAPFLMTIYEAARIFFHWPLVLIAVITALELFQWGADWGAFFQRLL
jgi:membrane protease YdiL (CAAX protease family)